MGHLLFGFSGRANRAKWWLAVLVLFIIGLVIGLMDRVVESQGLVVTIAGLVLSVVSLWITLAAGTKRLHDLNRTGAWLVLFVGAPIVLSIVLVAIAGAALGTAILSGATPSEEEIIRSISGIAGIAGIIGLIGLAIGIWYLVWLGCLRGTVGPNQYGPDPLEGKI